MTDLDKAVERLTADAKAILAAHFGFGSMKTTLTFQTPWNITERAKAALQEAVDAGLIDRQTGVEGLYAETYRPTTDLTGLRRWMEQNRDAGKFSVMVSAEDRKERPPRDWPLPRGFKRHPQ